MAPLKPVPTALAHRRGKVLSGSTPGTPSSQTGEKIPGQTPSAAPSSLQATPSSQTRGKFLGNSSPPSRQATPSSQTRGKFLGKNPAGPPSSVKAVASSGSNGADAENDSLDKLRAHVHNSKIAAVSRRKSISGQRQSVLDDLDEAENIVLSLLECASETSGALSEMTTAKSRKRHGEKRDDGEGKAEESFEVLTANVRSNGVGYLAGVKKLHKLLSPHASLVKSYKNHGGETSSDETEIQTHASLATSLPGVTGATNSKIVEDATSNMYAVRVKKRLAMERSELMKEMIRLEELNGCGEDECEGGEEGTKNNNTAGSKRNHGST